MVVINTNRKATKVIWNHQKISKWCVWQCDTLYDMRCTLPIEKKPMVENSIIFLLFFNPSLNLNMIIFKFPSPSLSSHKTTLSQYNFQDYNYHNFKLHKVNNDSKKRKPHIFMSISLIKIFIVSSQKVSSQCSLIHTKKFKQVVLSK